FNNHGDGSKFSKFQMVSWNEGWQPSLFEGSRMNSRNGRDGSGNAARQGADGGSVPASEASEVDKVGAGAAQPAVQVEPDTSLDEHAIDLDGDGTNDMSSNADLNPDINATQPGRQLVAGAQAVFLQSNLESCVQSLFHVEVTEFDPIGTTAGTDGSVTIFNPQGNADTSDIRIQTDHTTYRQTDIARISGKTDAVGMTNKKKNPYVNYVGWDL